MDYYSILGVNRNASQEEIKKAYKKMCMKHHPDRGGNEAEFKRVNEAYDTLSDPQKKQMHDMGVDPNRQQQGGFRQGPFEFRFGDNFDDIFGGFGFRQPRRKANKSISISVTISLEDVLQGKTIHVDIAMPSGSKVVTIDIPKGVEEGQHIRYQGLGDSSIQGLPPGDLIVYIHVNRHPLFTRQGNNLYFEKSVSIWDCILGSSITINTINNRQLNIGIPAGTQPETVLSCKGEGLPDIHSHRLGNLLIKIKVEVPRNLSTEQIRKVQELKNGS